jgi:hypothetical protein
LYLILLERKQNTVRVESIPNSCLRSPFAKWGPRMGYKIRTALGAGTDKLRGAEFAESFSAPFLGPKGGPANPSPYLVTKTTYISSTPILGSTCFLFWTNKEFRPTDHGRSCVALIAYSLQRGPRTEISCFESAEVGLYSALVP